MPGSSTLSVATTAGTAIGNYTITITGVAGSNTHTTTVNLAVSGPDFSLSFANPTITAEPGTKADAVVSITRLGGLTGKVTITPPTNLPAGVKISPATPISAKGDTATFKLKITKSAAAGSYTLTFSGTDDLGNTHSAMVTLDV